ncbi:ATP-dependent helicase [Acinetobacter modestus]|uniref:UvrD-helicase domain-containing protein n=1 Tax=Acinetobacter modestus TaxID=1776740 RepID=UPI001F4B6571|nr:ATP-dependent helicase [Acinetobacter modestus]MCH7387454.1 ATP-dependent helicase [Acinetobacter modestus]
MFILKEGMLNEEQEKAIFEEDSILLVACPGSGKTRTLTYKIAYELSKLDSNKKYIIAITYTNSAAEEIYDRVEALGVDTKQLWIGTIHAFCLHWILRPYYLYLEPLKYGYTLINSFDSEKLLKKLCIPYKSKRIDHWDCGVIAKPDGMYLTCSEIKKHDSLKQILDEYYSILSIGKQVDFEQILKYSWDLLNKYSVISKNLSKIFSLILVDEYQDTREIQYCIIAKIINHGKGETKAFIVGDPNQSIYDSLGGFPMSKVDLENLFGFKITELSLNKNYRSSDKIVNYFDYFKIHSNSIFASGENKNYPSLITYNKSISVDSLLDEISNLILLNINNYGIKPNEICIVAPQWVHIGAVTRRLIAKLPNYSFDGPGIAPFSRDIDNFWFKLSKIILTEPSPDMYIRRLRWSSEILSDLSLLGLDIDNINSKNLLRICNTIMIYESDGLTYLRCFFSKIFEQLNIVWNEVPTLQEHYDSFFESSEDRINRLKKEGIDGVESIENFKKVFRQRDGITVSTIHGVKGEEYDTVIGFALLKDYIPNFNDTNGDTNSKKLLYVLASRARKNLHLISETMRAVHHYHSPKGKVPTPHLSNYIYNYDI